jgi:hypothetical protein
MNMQTLWESPVTIIFGVGTGGGPARAGFRLQDTLQVLLERRNREFC